MIQKRAVAWTGPNPQYTVALQYGLELLGMVSVLGLH